MVRTAVLLAAGMAALGGCQESDPWKPFTHVETGFTLTFPGKPTDTMESQNTAFGLVDTFIVSVQPPGDELKYQMRVDTYPPPIAQLGDSSALIFARQKRYESEIEGKATSEETIELGPQRGRAFTFEYPDGNLEFARIFMVNTTMFHASVFAPPTAADRPEIARFLESLALPEKGVHAQALEDATN